MKELGIGDVIIRMERAFKAAGSQREWALKHGISLQDIFDVLIRRKEPTGPILDALNLRAVTFYYPADVIEHALGGSK